MNPEFRRYEFVAARDGVPAARAFERRNVGLYLAAARDARRRGGKRSPRYAAMLLAARDCRAVARAVT